MDKFYKEKDKIYASKMHEVFNYEYEQIKPEKPNTHIYNKQLESLDDETKRLVGAADQGTKQMIVEYKNMSQYI